MKLTRAEFLEDVEFMASTGASFVEACQRLNTAADALENRLRRAGRVDLLTRLRSRDPLPITPEAEAIVRQADAWRRKTAEPDWLTAQRRAVLEGLAS